MCQGIRKTFSVLEILYKNNVKFGNYSFIKTDLLIRQLQAFYSVNYLQKYIEKLISVLMFLKSFISY